jgi:phospholipid/cholesterol/gamma-HCH transport system substrate-binding protein
MSRSTRSRAVTAAVKLAIFTTVSVVVTGTLILVMGRFGTGDTVRYTAEFSDASMLASGDDVRVAGIVRGKVKDVEIHEDNRALVSFEVATDLTLTTTTRAEVRYLDLVGGRYLALEAGTGGDRLHAGDRIGMEHTSPALDLSELYNGFAPLFAALSPEDINEFTHNLISVLQGEGGTVEQLLASTASLTTSLADRDELVGEVITNLSQLLETVDERHQELTDLIGGLRGWLTKLARDRHDIGNAIVSVSEMARTLGKLLTRGRPLLKQDIAEIRTLANHLNRPESREIMTQVLRTAPELFTEQLRVGSYGSWYNYYFCKLKLDINLPEALQIPALKDLLDELHRVAFHSTAERCEPSS